MQDWQWKQLSNGQMENDHSQGISKMESAKQTMLLLL
jgi:hypothetical protein